MTALMTPPRTVPTASATTRRTPAHVRAARALSNALRNLMDLLPQYEARKDREARRRFAEETWFPAGDAAGRAEEAVLGQLRSAGSRFSWWTGSSISISCPATSSTPCASTAG